MLRSSEIEAITEWHWSMATIFEFICYHVHVARWLRKWPKWAIGSTSAAESGAWHVRKKRYGIQCPENIGPASTWVASPLPFPPPLTRSRPNQIAGPGPKSGPARKSESRGPENGVSRWRRPNSDIYSQNHHFGLVYDMIYQFLGMEAKNYKFGMFCQQCHPSVASGDADIRPRNASRIHTCHLFTS